MEPGNGASPSGERLCVQALETRRSGRHPGLPAAKSSDLRASEPGSVELTRSKPVESGRRDGTESAAKTAKSPEMASAESTSSTKVASASLRGGPESEGNGGETSGNNHGKFSEHSLHLHKQDGRRGKTAPEHWFQGWGLVLRRCCSGATQAIN